MKRWETLGPIRSLRLTQSSHVHCVFIRNSICSERWIGSVQNSARPQRWKTIIAIVVTALVSVAVGGALAAMNNACKRTQHSWCGPHFVARHHMKAERS